MRMSENEGAETPRTKDAARAEFFKEEANVHFKSMQNRSRQFPTSYLISVVQSRVSRTNPTNRDPTSLRGRMNFCKTKRASNFRDCVTDASLTYVY